MPYTTSHICQLYGVSNETVRSWSIEFKEYLSATAQPAKHKKRSYTVADLTVFSYVAECKKQGMTFADIHAGLKTGQRGESPPLEPRELQLITSGEIEKRLALQIEHLEDAIVRLQTQLKEAQAEAQNVQQVREENVRLQTSLEHTDKQLGQTQQRLDETIAELSRKIEELSKQAGEAYAKGYVTALREQSELDEN